MPSTSEELAAAGLDPSFADTAGGSLEAAHAADVIFPRSAAEGVITHARLMWPARLQAATICGSSMLRSADPHAQSPWVPGAGKGRRCSSCRLLAPSRAANRRPDVRRGPPRNDRGADVTAPPRLDSANHAGTESLRTRRWRGVDSNFQFRHSHRVAQTGLSETDQCTTEQGVGRVPLYPALVKATVTSGLAGFDLVLRAPLP
jgi:hypothetical protein